MKLIKIGLIVLLIPLIAYQVVVISRMRGDSGNDPVISSNVDEIRIPCQYNEEDLLKGLTAHDAEDGDITDKILIGGFSDFTQRGISSLEYAVYDREGNMTTFNRRVIFSDYIPPRIKLFDPFVFKATDYTPSLYLEGWDKIDGNISKHILITGPDIDFSKPGKYTISVYLKNSFGDEVSMDLPIHILDSEQNGYIVDVKEALIYVDKGASVSPESYFGGVRSEYTNDPIPDTDYELTINSDVDTSKDGIYEIHFSAVSPDKSQSGETWMTVVVGDYGG